MRAGWPVDPTRGDTCLNARLTRAPHDADFALDCVKRNATTPELREAVCRALLFKTDVLEA